MSDEFSWGAPPPSSDIVEVSRPPVLWIGVAGLLAVAGAVVAWAFASVPLVWVGWVLAGPLAFGALAGFQNRDLRARAQGVYGEPGWLKPVYWATTALVLLCVCACAYRLADWIGRIL